ncbi:hypothetical protein HMPREF1624_00942 [Sporothrix schenckii ATCC 58251]|uniref:Uncharacterized protein n=1 Tax=Sporothrix schenckii (strain ATCC 58251 / de Perez 2211183) TaxID=1391915 RepID=U7Q7D0_SPOS1|nr:hypothetical protein HMPREF1624_00942 [Sporothrix schenckii ATCC 58251]
MSTNANLASGQFITTISGKRCTAVPKAGGGGGGSAATTAANNGNRNGGTVQATFSAVQAASSSATSDSTTTTSTLVTSTSTTSTSTSATTSSTSTSISTSTQEANVAPAPDVQETTTDSPLSTTSSALPTNQNVPGVSSPQAQAQPQTTPVTIQPSQADTGVIATLATASATTATQGAPAGAAAAASVASAAAAASVATGGPQSITNGNGAAIFSTIAAPPEATDDGSSTAAAAAAAGGDGNNAAIGAVTNTPGTNPEATIAIAGGVIGGVAFLCLVAFLVWFWRRRMRKRRRSTLLTPLSTDPATFGGRGGGDGTMRNGEKGEYVINRGSIGPTPKTERIKATLDYNIRRIKGRFGDMVASRASNGSVNMDRGNSQFMAANNVSGSRDSNTTNNTENTDAANGGYGAAAKDRVAGWFSRIAGAGAGLTSKLRGGSNVDAGGQNEKRAMDAQPNKKDGQPDFLTLLGMDERELERAAQNKKNSKKKRASMDRGRTGSNGNNDYLGRLNIDFDDPFSDSNAIAHQSAKPAPLAVSQTNNPFSDANAIRSNGGEYSNPKPNTYVADIRRSRGQNDRLTDFRLESMYRDSVQTVNTVDTSAKRNRFRSDPFDLERPELLQLGRSTPRTVTSSNMSVAGSSNAPRMSDASGSRLSGGVGTGEIRRPRTAHQRGDSFTSKYSSGVSMGEWSDPGPDVGPSAPMWGDNNSDRRRDSPTKGRQRSNSDESSSSVGKAL